MGAQDVSGDLDEREVRQFTRAVLRDVEALERLLESGRVESGVRRIGAEQEMFLVDRAMQPAPIAMEVLARTDDPRLTTEIARFNIEGNLAPQRLTAGALLALEQQAEDLVASTRKTAQDCGGDVVLTGILPTLRLSDLTLANMTPLTRYAALDRALRTLRGGPFSVHIKGLDELHVHHDNVMFEACNTSFQVHLQVDPEDFARQHNLAQAISAPVMAASVNSPLLLGHRLWQETRLALFQHAVDERSTSRVVRSQPTRVAFGNRWLENSVLEMYRDDLTRFRILLTREIDEDPLAVLEAGGVPRLTALSLHNGTVWRWNRACYGVADGTFHLRIENRILPSGPTVHDEVASAAVFIGLMCALPAEYGDIRQVLSFDDAKANFFAAARHGLDAQLAWTGGRRWPASSLLLEHLLPLARAGLADHGLDATEIDRYLGTVEERVRGGRTGSTWMLRSLDAMGGSGTPAQRSRALTGAMLAAQCAGDPVHRWPLAGLDGGADWLDDYRAVGQYMTTDVFTVAPDESIDLIARIMDWKHIRHVPVEDADGRLVGLISHRDLLRGLAAQAEGRDGEGLAARDLMKPEPVTATPSTSTVEVLGLMCERGIGCVPVVEADHLVGIVTAYDLLGVSRRLLEERLGQPAGSPSALPSEPAGSESDSAAAGAGQYDEGRHPVQDDRTR